MWMWRNKHVSLQNGDNTHYKKDNQEKLFHVE